MLRGLGALLLLAAFGAASPAAAHTRSETHSNWRIAGSEVHVTFTVPDLEAQRLVERGQPPPSPAVLGAYVAKHLSAQAGGQPCPQSEAVRAIQATPGMQRFELAFKCPSDKALAVGSSAFFEKVATHTNFAQIQTADGKFIEQLITQDQQVLPLDSAAGGDLKNASFFKYILMGMMHIFTGIDHQSFLLGLVLLSRRLKDLTFVITGFTLGHSATLALAVTGLLRPHAEYIDALVGLTIALVGAECMAENTHKPLVVALGLGGLMFAMAALRVMGVGSLPPLLLLGGGLFAASYLVMAGHLRDAGRMRLVVTLVFGLIHGFGFASDLLEMRLPTQRLAELLVGFNIGVEIGQLSIVLGLVVVVALLVRLRFYLPRQFVTDLGSSFLLALGLFWFVSRSYV